MKLKLPNTSSSLVEAWLWLMGVTRSTHTVPPGAMPSQTDVDWFEFGCARAALAGLAGRDGSGVSATEGAAEADAAMAPLRKAVAMGYRSPDAYRTEDALDPLRGRDDFKLLMLELAMPAEPFGAAR